MSDIQSHVLSTTTGYVLLVVFGLIWVAMGIYWGRKARDLEGFMLAGRNVGLALGAATAMATWVTSNTVMLAPLFALKMGIWGMLAYSTASLGLRTLHRNFAALRRRGHVRREGDRTVELVPEGFNAKVGGDLTTLGGVLQQLQTPTVFPVAGLAALITTAEQMIRGSGPAAGAVFLVSANEIVARAGSASVDGVSVAANAFVGRGSGDLGDVAVGTDELVGRSGSGALGGQSIASVLTMLSLDDVIKSDDWPDQSGITGSTTINADTALASVNPSGDITLTLATPSNPKVLIVSDSDGDIGASDGVRFLRSGSDTINGNTDWPSGGGFHTTPNAIFLLVYSTGSANWTAVELV